MRPVVYLTRWHVQGTITNPEQLLLLVVIPIAALLAVVYTPLGSGTISIAGLITLALMGASFTSPAITWAFEREQGTWALIASAPVSRLQWWWALLLSILTNVALSVGALLLAIFALPGVDLPRADTNVVALVVGIIMATALGVAWASALAGKLRATAVLGIANAVFVLAILFGGVLVPAQDLGWGALAQWLPPGAAVAYLDSALSAGTFNLTAFLTMIAWCVPGVILGTRIWRWR